MANIIADDIDFSEYIHETEFKVKVRKASQYVNSLKEHFNPKDRLKPAVEMFSTKLRGLLEFRPGELTIWAGYNGHRKSMFVGQVTLDLCFQNERTLVSSFEMLPVITLGRMARQCFAVSKPSEKSIDDFGSWTNNKLWIFDHLGRINPIKCLAVSRYFVDKLDGQQIIIDSMMKVCESEEHLDEQKQFITDLIDFAHETGVHIHLICHCRKPIDETKQPTKYDIRGSSAITDQADKIIIIWANKAKQLKLDIDPNDIDAGAMPDAIISVEKQRNAEFEGKLKMWFCKSSLRFSDNRMNTIEPYAINS